MAQNEKSRELTSVYPTALAVWANTTTHRHNGFQREVVRGVDAVLQQGKYIPQFVSDLSVKAHTVAIPVFPLGHSWWWVKYT